MARGNPNYLEDLATVGDLLQLKNELIEELVTRLKPAQSVKPKKWLKTKEVIALLKISPGKLAYLRKSKQLPYTPLGNVFYYEEDDVQKLMTGNKIS